MIDDGLLAALGVRPRERACYGDELARTAPAVAVDTPLRVAHFLAQTLHESALLRRTVENLNYDAAALRRVFPRYFTRAEAARYARDPVAIGNRVYANRLGNGDEASGDGYRFRGRGLIQLTGRDNYRRFAAWQGVDVLREPDRVGDTLAVASAAFYWHVNTLNRFADRDDLRGLTRAINGGLNGFADRLALLERARAVLASRYPVDRGMPPTHVVAPERLNIRSRPVVAAHTRIGVLPRGTPVTEIARASDPTWSEVSTVLNGSSLTGFVANACLDAIAEGVHAAVPVAAPAAPAVHWSAGDARVTRRRDGGRAQPLGEPDLPRRRARTPAAKARELDTIIDYLAVDRRDHLRYRAPRGRSYAHVYACDYCYLAGAYLPRVWWRGPALLQLATGQAPEVTYGISVGDVSSNALGEWLVDFGAAFGWIAVHDLDTLQAAANAGETCVIVAGAEDGGGDGHITVVVPESDRGRARRRDDDSVAAVVESEAGRRNRRRHVRARRWWISRRYRAFGFWRHP